MLSIKKMKQLSTKNIIVIRSYFNVPCKPVNVCCNNFILLYQLQHQHIPKSKSCLKSFSIEGYSYKLQIRL